MNGPPLQNNRNLHKVAVRYSRPFSTAKGTGGGGKHARSDAMSVLSARFQIVTWFVCGVLTRIKDKKITQAIDPIGIFKAGNVSDEWLAFIGLSDGVLGDKPQQVRLTCKH